MDSKKQFTRRSTLKGIGALGAVTFLGGSVGDEEKEMEGPSGEGFASDIRRTIWHKVRTTPFVDTHEHLIEEQDRLKGAGHPGVKCDDWALLMSHYLDSDFLTAGMPGEALDRFLTPGVDPIDKWKLIEPHWNAVNYCPGRVICV